MANMYITAQVISKITFNIVQQNYKFNVIIFETNFVTYKCLQIFPANTDVTTVVEKPLPTPVTPSACGSTLWRGMSGQTLRWKCMGVYLYNVCQGLEAECRLVHCPWFEISKTVIKQLKYVRWFMKTLFYTIK